ncbi:MAG TPA: universal stress protein [Candidatus Dormibacteraeota bacterium]|nr:universal stress protein [Candidatus Dormibacteraeota bacterium]
MTSAVRRVLVLIDGLHTRALVDAITRLVGLDGAHVLLLHVQGTSARSGLELASRRPGGRGLPPQRARDLEEAELRSGAEALAEAAAAFRDQAESVETMELRGEAGRLVCDTAARWRADLIAIRAGGRDRPPVGPASLGPAARFVTDHAPCAVLLIR